MNKDEVIKTFHEQFCALKEENLRLKDEIERCSNYAHGYEAAWQSQEVEIIKLKASLAVAVEALKEVKHDLINELKEPHRTTFWKVVKALEIVLEETDNG